MSSGNGNGAVDASLRGITDTELLAIVDDLADENGWTSTLRIRIQLGEKVDGNGNGKKKKTQRSGVGSRLSWMSDTRRDGLSYGWLERHPDTGMWRLTAMGHAILDDPELTRVVQRALDNLNPAQRVRLTRELGEAGVGSAREVFHAQRRIWQRSMGLLR